MKKKIILVISIIVVVIIVLLITLQLLPRPYNLTYPEYRTLEYKGEKLYFTVYKYEPPYIPPHFLKSRNEQNISTPEGTNLATTCAAGRDREWYKSLITEDYQKKLIKWYKKRGEDPFNEKRKDEPRTFHEPRASYTYKIGFMQDGNRYAKILEKQPIIIDGREENVPSYISFIQKDNIWLLDNVPYFYPSAILQNHGYDELLKESKPAKLTLIGRFKRWLDYTKLKIHYSKLKRKKVA